MVAGRFPRRCIVSADGLGWQDRTARTSGTRSVHPSAGSPAGRQRTLPPLPPTDPDDPLSYTYTTDLAAIRAVVHRYAIQAGLTEARAIDLTLAVSEVAANTVQHAKSPGSLKIWYDAKEIICQIHDEGIISDPLAGRRQPSLDAPGGHGLWIVNRVCDQVDMQSDENGTTIRLHMNLPWPGTAR